MASLINDSIKSASCFYLCFSERLAFYTSFSIQPTISATLNQHRHSRMAAKHPGLPSATSHHEGPERARAGGDPDAERPRCGPDTRTLEDTRARCNSLPEATNNTCGGRGGAGGASNVARHVCCSFPARQKPAATVTCKLTNKMPSRHGQWTRLHPRPLDKRGGGV